MKSIKLILLSALLLITAACGGGGGASPSTTVTGVASAGIIKQGDVKVFALYSTLAGKKQIGVGKTDDQGKYTINVGAYTGPVVVEVSGSYSDEANPNNTITISPLTPLRAMAVTSTGTVNVAVTPLTELGVRQTVALTTNVNGRITAADVNTANAQISDLFKIDNIVATQPLDPSASIAGGDTERVKYTLALAALSQYGAEKTSGDLGTALNALAGSIHTSGNMDLTMATDITTSLDHFITANPTLIDQASVPQDLSKIGKTTLVITAVLSGSGVKSVETDITLPNDKVSVVTNGGELANGVLTNLIGGSNPYLRGSSVSAGNIHVVFIETNSMPAGNIFTIKMEVAAGEVPPTASQFILSNTQLKDSDGHVVGTASLNLL